MKCKLECDVCGIKFTKPFIKAIQQLNCPQCDFNIIWDGEETNSIVEKNLTYQTQDVQFLFIVDLLEEYLVVEIQNCKSNKDLVGTIIAEIPLKNFDEVKLDYELVKNVLNELPKY